MPHTLGMIGAVAICQQDLYFADSIRPMAMHGYSRTPRVATAVRREQLQQRLYHVFILLVRCTCHPGLVCHRLVACRIQFKGISPPSAMESLPPLLKFGFLHPHAVASRRNTSDQAQGGSSSPGLPHVLRGNCQSSRINEELLKSLPQPSTRTQGTSSNYYMAGVEMGLQSYGRLGEQ